MNLSRFHKSLFVCLTILFSASFASAARYSVATGNWNSTATWSAQSGGTPGASVPAMGDAVTIEGGFTVTVTSNAACTSISYSTANSTSTLTVNSGITLAVSAAITIPRTGAAGINTLDVGAGTVSAASIAFTNSLTNVRHQITISTGTLTVSGNITINPTGWASPNIIFSGAGTLNVGGAFFSSTIGGTLTVVTSGGILTGCTVNYTSASAQTVGDFTYSNLTLSGGATKTLAGAIAVNNTLNIASSSIFDMNGKTLTAAGIITGTGKLKGSATSNLVIFGSGAFGTIYFDQTTSGSTNLLNNLTINRTSSGTVTLGDTLRLKGTLTTSAGTLSSNGYLRLISSATATANIASGSCITCSYISGNVAVERYVPPVSRRYRFLSSPIVSTTLDDWQNEMFVTGTGGSANGFDQTTSNSSSCFYYDEVTNTWSTPTSTSYSLEKGKGYRIFIRGDRSDNSRLTGINNTQNTVTLDLVGSVNQGNITMPVSYTATSNTFGRVGVY